MDDKELTCIACPRGCRLSVKGTEDTPSADNLSITGNRCPKGIEYAVQEITDPRRILTSTVATAGRQQARLSVKTSGELRRDLLFAAMDEIHRIRVTESSVPGDVIAADFMGQGLDLVATGEWDGK